MKSWSNLANFISIDQNLKLFDQNSEVLLIFGRVLRIRKDLMDDGKERLDADVLIDFFKG